jgi:phosphate transport system permease protein
MDMLEVLSYLPIRWAINLAVYAIILFFVYHFVARYIRSARKGSNMNWGNELRELMRIYRGWLRGEAFLFPCFLFAAILVFLIAVFIFWQSIPALSEVGFVHLVFSTDWETYGIGAFIVASFLITVISVFIAVIIGLPTAIYLVEFIPARIGSLLRPFIDMLAGIPSILYGLWGLYAFRPILKDHIAPFIDSVLGFIPFFCIPQGYTGCGALLAAIVLAIMIFPTFIGISNDAIKMVPAAYREASFALGATRWETVKKIVLPNARSGIVVALILSIGRVIGETMAVLFLCGGGNMIPQTIYGICTPMTAKIAGAVGYNLDNPMAMSALFMIGFVLFLISLSLIFVVNIVLRKGKLA